MIQEIKNTLGWMFNRIGRLLSPIVEPIADYIGKKLEYTKPYPKLKTITFNVVMVFFNMWNAIWWSAKFGKLEDFGFWPLMGTFAMVFLMGFCAWLEASRILQFYLKKKELPDGATHFVSEFPNDLHIVIWQTAISEEDILAPGKEINPVFYYRNQFLWTWSKAEVTYIYNQNAIGLKDIYHAVGIKKTKLKSKKDANNDMMFEQLKGNHVLVIKPGEL